MAWQSNVPYVGCIIHTPSRAPVLASSLSHDVTLSHLTDPVPYALTWSWPPQERDRTIVQLQHSLDASRRRCALLESQLAGPAGGGGQGTGAQGGGSGGGSSSALAEVLTQSALQERKYRQIRDDYNRLLNK